MLTLMLSDSNAHEYQVLETVFTQHQFVVIRFSPSYQFYVKLLQYSPEIIIMEMPPVCKDHLHFIDLIHKHKKLSAIPLIGFGDVIDTMVYNYYRKMGLNSYIVRPLKFSILTERIELHLHKKVMSEKKANIEPSQDDLTYLFDPAILPLKKIEYIADRISKLLAFPFTATKVMSLSNSDTSGAKQLAQVINADPTISAQILKVANSVFFASLNRRINSIHDAIVRIGFSETKRIVSSMAIMNLFDRKLHNAGFDRTEFWYHSVGCAIVSERIARKGAFVNPDEAFLSGLLHDLGILLFDEYFPQLLCKLLESTTENATSFIAEEKSIMSITHIDVTSTLFEKWKLPTNIIKSISKKDNFRTFSRDMVEESQIAVCLGMGETLTKTLFIGKECDQVVEPIDNDLFSNTRLSGGFNESFIKEIDNDILFYQQFLKLEKNDSEDGVQNIDSLKVALLNVSKDLFVPPAVYLRREGATVIDFSTFD
ncbi:MAG TPA: HDOD domain-containing protein, partial [Chitinispirillaceae bacterium]|nr:HDOD domain-containing protein [Chitinispirillaceae bacterium]